MEVRMNIDERISTKMAEVKSELMDLFQYSDSRGDDALRALQILQGLLPLIEDIKTEIDQINRNLRYVPQDDDDEDEQEDQPRNTDRSPFNPDPGPYLPGPDDPTTKDIIENLPKELQQLNDVLHKMEDNDVLDPLVDHIPWLWLAVKSVDIAHRLKKNADDLDDRVKKRMENSQADTSTRLGKIQYTIEETAAALQEAGEYLTDSVKDVIESLRQKESDDFETTLEKLLDILNLDGNIKHDTETIQNQNSTTHDKLDGMSQDMSNCCQNMDTKISQNINKSNDIKRDTEKIKDDIGKLQPSTQSNQSLAIVTKLNGVLAGIDEIRGLL